MCLLIPFTLEVHLLLCLLIQPLDTFHYFVENAIAAGNLVMLSAGFWRQNLSCSGMSVDTSGSSGNTFSKSLLKIATAVSMFIWSLFANSFEEAREQFTLLRADPSSLRLIRKVPYTRPIVKMDHFSTVLRRAEDQEQELFSPDFEGLLYVISGRLLNPISKTSLSCAHIEDSLVDMVCTFGVTDQFRHTRF